MTDEQPGGRRAYDSPVRRQRAAETRARIVDAGAELLRGHAVWNWDAITVRAVAERAGVSERTVYRHFNGERELRDAVFARLEQEAGVALEGLRLEDLRAAVARIFEFVSAFPLEPRGPKDPTLAVAGQRQRDALVAALAPHTQDWPDADRHLAAAVLDVLWGTAAYERIVADWHLDPEAAIRGLTWVVGLIEQAVRDGRRPGA